MLAEWDLRWRKFDSNGKPTTELLPVARTSEEINELKSWISLTTEKRIEISAEETNEISSEEAKREFGILTFIALCALYWYFAYPIGMWVFEISFGWILTLFGMLIFITLKEYKKCSFKGKKQMRNIIQLSFFIVLVIQVILSMIYGILDALLMGSSGIVLILILLLHIPIILLFFSGGSSGGSSIQSPQHAVYYNNTTGKVEHHFYRGNVPPHNQFHRQKIGQGNHTLNYLRRIK